MDGIPIPEQDVISIDHIADGVSGLRIVMVNVFAVSHPNGGWTLIDAGLPYSTQRIRAWVREKFSKLGKAQAVVLTHGHFDHVGALRELADEWDVPVYAHEQESPYLTGKEKYPAPDPRVGGGLMALMSPFYPRDSANVSDRLQTFRDGEPVPTMPEWRVVHTPGHTAGHVSFFRERDRALIVGDAFSTTKAESVLAIATQKPELHGPPAYYTSDWDLARISVEKLAQLRPTMVAPGHGSPMGGTQVADALTDFASNFDLIARPASKKVA